MSERTAQENTDMLLGTAASGEVVNKSTPSSRIIRGDALELIESHDVEPLDLVVTDPPYAFGGSGEEHELSATVAVVLRETARRLKKGRWMVVMCATSWRSTSYMVDAMRGVVQPVRIARWNKPAARTKARTTGWKWAGVNVIAFRKGSSLEYEDCADLDHITAPPVIDGRRAQLPREVADWMVRPFAVADGAFLDPFAGSGVIVESAHAHGMRALGFERQLT
jgi:DNA modification methylase